MKNIEVNFFTVSFLPKLSLNAAFHRTWQATHTAVSRNIRFRISFLQYLDLILISYKFGASLPYCSAVF